MYQTSKIVISPRVRKSPYFDSTMKYGASAFTIYNHMYLPIVFEGPEKDYENLLNGVQLWDVGVERQIEIKGPDASKLSQYITPRDVHKCNIGQAMYAPLLDFQGGFINDPVMLKLAEDHFWFSLSDSDALLWVQGVASANGYDAEISEPDVSPLQIQGPNSTELMSKVFGKWIEELAFYKFKEVNHAGIPMVIARMGYSRERCYEIFLQDGSKGNELWEILWDAGQDLNITPGTPNQIFRLEAGILSFGADMHRDNNPFEVGLDWMIDLDQKDDFIGKEALETIKQNGIKKKLMGAEIAGPKMEFFNEENLDVSIDGDIVGEMMSAVFSPRFKKNICYIILDVEHALPGKSVDIQTPEGELKAELVKLPWITDRA
ncbi:MAG TPA: glycine cleavage T C-terminal barrel domain-containing protein [Gammaproteobacteria bacterium]|jgi:aminomethyltransferase|nr:glycine cleavage T C-terminal barrel domain-containing protein [Gammaproteobacteria bacterium]